MNKIVGTLATTVGVVSGFIGIIAVSDRNLRSAGISVIVTALSVAVAITLFRYYRDRKRESVGGCWDEDLKVGFQVRSASESDLRWISDLQQSVYSTQDAVPLSIISEWFDANPNGFFIVATHDGEPVGHMTILPIKSNTLKRYIKEGDDGLIETEIRGDCLYSPDESAFISDIYIESIILPKKYRPSIHRAVIRAIPTMVARVKADITSGRVFAMAATSDGESVLSGLGFSKVSRAEARRDHHNMYQSSLPELLNRVSKLRRRLDNTEFASDSRSDNAILKHKIS